MLSPHQSELLKHYSTAVSSAPEHYALTSAKDREIFFQRHVLDAVALAETLPPLLTEGAISAVDVGTGNGIPGVVLAILHPSWDIVLLDSNHKKCLFLESFCASSGLRNAEVRCERAEVFMRGEGFERFDLAFARALGPLSTALELCVRGLKVGGTVIVSHGTSYNEQLSEASTAVKVLGLRSETVKPYSVGDLSFYALPFVKVAETDPKFPRPIGRPAKRPL